MYSLNLPAGCAVRLSATAKAAAPIHRWDVRVTTADVRARGSTPRLSYGSQIGGADREQHVDIPAQDVACRLDVGASCWSGVGWDEDSSVVSNDTPTLLELGFGGAESSPSRRQRDIQLSFQFKAARRA